MQASIATVASLVLLVACSRGSGSSSPASDRDTKPPARAERGGARELLFTGMCDASAAVALSGQLVVVADDEENVLRVYDVEQGGSPTSSTELSGVLSLPTKRRKDGSASSRELDIEAAARIGSRAYFITSHGRDSRGRLRTERFKFFALGLDEPANLRLFGTIYERLLDDLLQEPRLAAYHLADASRLPPKAAGGLNIEGMTARVEGGVWLGFRNPVPEGRALLVPFLNPEGVVLGSPPAFGDPLGLDLRGRGVRALARWRGSYFIAAGAFDDAPTSALFRWDGGSVVEELRVPALGQYNPEALFAADERDELLFLSDDGTARIGGRDCKKLRDASQRRFRGLWLKPGP